MRPTYTQLRQDTLTLALQMQARGWRLYNYQPEIGHWSGCATHRNYPNCIVVVRERDERFTCYEAPAHNANPAGACWHVEWQGFIQASGPTIPSIDEIERRCRPPKLADITLDNGWIWIRFHHEPDQSAIQTLLDWGATWSGKRQAYFVKNPDLLSEVKDLIWDQTMRQGNWTPTTKRTTSPGTTAANRPTTASTAPQPPTCRTPTPTSTSSSKPRPWASKSP